MRTLGFTGTRNIGSPREVAEAILPWVLTDFRKFDRFVTGGCRGFDREIGYGLATMLPDKEHVVIVPANRSQVDEWWADLFTQKRVADAGGSISIIEMPEGTSYKDRNQLIVGLADELFYYAEYPEDDGHSRRSGTWQTVRLARKKEIPVEGVIINA